MKRCIPSLLVLLTPLAPAFREEVFETFCLMTGAWILCLGRRTISRVWETTGEAKKRNHASAFRLFSEAAWNWDEVCRLLMVEILASLVPGTKVWLVVDDTLCHKRGAKVAFGGIFLDAVLSSKKHKVFRFGNNWVMMGIVIELALRPNRYFCLPIAWRVYEKRGTKAKQEHRTKCQLAAEMIVVVAGWFPLREFLVVADIAYIGKALLKGRPANVAVLGPLCWNAALYETVTEPRRGHQHGKRLATPKAMLANDGRWPAKTMRIEFKNGRKRALEVKEIREVCWYTAAGSVPVHIVLVRDPKGKWRDEALVCTDLSLSAQEMITGYCRRWSVEVAFCDAKQMLGFHDPQVWSEKSVERAAPMSWFVGSLIVLWYTVAGHAGSGAQRERPWYKNKETPTMAEMLAACRIQMWESWINEVNAEAAPAARREEKLTWLLNYIATST
jgi:DDE superfamily endonuclease